MNKILIGLAVIVLIGVGIYFWVYPPMPSTPTPEPTTTTQQPQATTTPAESPVASIGQSVEGRPITAYHFGKGDTELLFVGGIHGGYEWNTVLVAYDLVDYLQEHPEAVPANVQVTVIPVLNPDGLEMVVGTTSRFAAKDVPAAAQTVQGRFNANTVDLNRNFDCDWQSTGTWQNTRVSGGGKAFSEPESQAIKAYVEEHDPEAVVAWYSAAGGVFASACHGDVLADTTTLTKLFADASGYKAYQDFDFYEITGDMVNWLAKEGVPAISVLLTNHTDTEWSKNWKGVKALLDHYAEN